MYVFVSRRMADVQIAIDIFRSACTLLACLNNPVLNGEDAFRNIDLRVIDDITDDGSETTKVPLQSTVQRFAMNASPNAGLAYVQYDELHERG